MKSSKTIFGYRIRVLNDLHSEYAHLEVNVRTGTIGDASEEYVRNCDDYNLERLKKIRAITGGVKYFDATFCSEVMTLRWQTDRENWKREVGNGNPGYWYAPRIDNGAVNPYTVKVLAALLKYCEKHRIYHIDITPQATITALKTTLKASRIEYMNDVGYSSFRLLDKEEDDKAVEGMIAECPWPSMKKLLDEEAKVAVGVSVVAGE